MAFKSSRSRSGFSEWGGFAPYVPVAQRQAQAAKTAAKAAKAGETWSPVKITGRKIAATFWGTAWCDHLESYGDFANRLPRGRTYVRNGSVLDLGIERGLIKAKVAGSSLYLGAIRVAPLAPARWTAIKAACAGRIESLVGLLQGRIPEAVLRVITDRETGLFPAPAEIRMECSCPDHASLCKHLAAVLYGVGARLDGNPELLFLLRGVDHHELIAEALGGAGAVAGGEGAGLGDGDLADVFGIEIADTGGVAAVVATGDPVVRSGLAKEVKAASKPKKADARTANKRVKPKGKTKPRSGGKPKAQTTAPGGGKRLDDTLRDVADALAKIGAIQAKRTKK